MIFRSIRSRLSLSFAVIALITTVVLGVILLAILQNYYLKQELTYLRGNAQVISGVMTAMLSGETPHDEVQSLIENLAFLSQTRVQVYDIQGQLSYDSGHPQNANVNLGVMKQTLAQANSNLPKKNMVFLSANTQNGVRVQVQSPNTSTPPGTIPDDKGVIIYRSVQATGSPFGFDLNAVAGSEGERSKLKITELIRDPQSAKEIGTVSLSEGPAYGTTILKSVAKGWALAGVIAVLLAAVMGWFISRRISAPVLALTDVTGRMAQGDLSSRADVKNQDEFGQLGLSFNEMADQVETTVATLRRFVSDAAHELRTPLTALRTNLDLALDEKDAKDRSAFLASAHAMVQRLQELNTNLLDLSRLEANGLVAKKTIIDLTDLLQTGLESYASQAEQASLVFEDELPSASIYIYADENQIRRVIDNLMDNACKFTPQDGTVCITLSQQDQQAIFSVTDSGIGIPADDLPQIFNRFHRGRNTTSYPGSGLGLAIVKAIVIAHSGSVEVQSAGEGQGSQFLIRLPAVSSPVS